MKKILFYLRALNIGGAETFIYNVLEKLDTNLYHIDIVLQSEKNENIRLLELCKEKRVKIFFTEPFEKHYFKSYSQLLSIVRDNGYDAIHFHANSLINNLPIRVAKKTKCKLIIHSHNSNNNVGGFIGKILHLYNRRTIIRRNAIRLSCSDKAGIWMFGDKEYTLINNGINLDTFIFDQNARIKLRKKYKIPLDAFVWGHVGRYVKAKNHAFLIKCFNDFSIGHPEAWLVSLGDGPQFNEIKESTSNDNILFLGSLQNSSKFYSMFDVLVFPSFFEGLPFVLVEAQASGLPIIASDRISGTVDKTGLVKFLSLDKPIDEWINEIASVNKLGDRPRYCNLLRNTIYDSDMTVRQIVEKYKTL